MNYGNVFALCWYTTAKLPIVILLLDLGRCKYFRENMRHGQCPPIVPSSVYCGSRGDGAGGSVTGMGQTWMLSDAGRSGGLRSAGPGRGVGGSPRRETEKDVAGQLTGSRYPRCKREERRGIGRQRRAGWDNERVAVAVRNRESKRPTVGPKRDLVQESPGVLPHALTPCIPSILFRLATPSILTHRPCSRFAAFFFASPPPSTMTTRHRTTSTSRNDYGLWRPSDGSDSDRPRQTMATTQRHNVGQTPVLEAPRKHRSSRRQDPAELLDPSAAYGRHKSSSKDRSSTANQASYYIIPPSPNPSVQHQTNTAHYDLRAYLKQKTEKRSPGISNDKGLAADEGKPSRSGHRSRHAYADPAAYNAAVAAAQSYSTPAAHATRDPTSSSRHHRERDKDREKTTRDSERTRTRDPTTERNEDRERRRRREREVEKERPSKDKERTKEKERRKDREGRAAAARPADATSVYQAYAQTAVAQRPADKASASYPVRPHILLLARDGGKPFNLVVGHCSAPFRATPSNCTCPPLRSQLSSLGWSNFRWAWGCCSRAGVRISLCVGQGRSTTSHTTSDAPTYIF